MYQYKFVKVSCKIPEEEVNSQLNALGNQGWKLINFHPTSDEEMGKSGMFRKVETWDIGYVFVFMKEV